jgi:hypothetical protein
VVAVRRDPCLSGRASADPPTVVELFNLRADGLESGDHRGDPVRLLHPKLAGIADLGWLVHRCHGHRDERQLVDELGHLAAADADRAQRTAAADADLADGLRPADVGDARLDGDAHSLEQADEPEAGRVEADVHHRQLGIGVQGGGDQPGRCSGGIARHHHLERPRACQAGHGGPLALAADRDAEEGEHALGMVARRAWGLDGRLALCPHAGDGRGAQQLRAGDRQPMGRRLQRRASGDRHRRMAVGGGDLRAGRPQQRRDALHRATTEGCVAVERCREAQPCHHAGEQPHGRAGVAAVELRVARWQSAEQVPLADLLDGHAERPQAVDRAQHVTAR